MPSRQNIKFPANVLIYPRGDTPEHVAHCQELNTDQTSLDYKASWFKMSQLVDTSASKGVWRQLRDNPYIFGVSLVCHLLFSFAILLLM